MFDPLQEQSRMEKTIPVTWHIDWRQPQRREYLNELGHARPQAATTQGSAAWRVWWTCGARGEAQQWYPVLSEMQPLIHEGDQSESVATRRLNADKCHAQRWGGVIKQSRGLLEDLGGPIRQGVVRDRPDENEQPSGKHPCKDYGSRRPHERERLEEAMACHRLDICAGGAKSVKCCFWRSGCSRRFCKSFRWGRCSCSSACLGEHRWRGNCL